MRKLSVVILDTSDYFVPSAKAIKIPVSVADLLANSIINAPLIKGLLNKGPGT